MVSSWLSKMQHPIMEFWDLLESCAYENCPDYEMLIKLMVNLQELSGSPIDAPYDWETNISSTNFSSDITIENHDYADPGSISSLKQIEIDKLNIPEVTDVKYNNFRVRLGPNFYHHTLHQAPKPLDSCLDDLENANLLKLII
jgi:hypothetical protein